MPAPVVAVAPGIPVDSKELDALIAEANEEIARTAEELPGTVPAVFAESTRALTALFNAPRQLHTDEWYRRFDMDPPAPKWRPITISRDMECGGFAIPLAGGWLARIELTGDGTKAFGDDPKPPPWFQSAAYIRREPTGIRVYEQPPRDVSSTRVESVAGTVWVSSARRWMHADITLSVTADAAMAVFTDFEMSVNQGECGARNGLRLTHVGIDGTDRWTTAGETFAFPVATPGRPVKVHLRFEGHPEMLDRHRRVALVSEWLPWPAGDAPSKFDLTVFHDTGSELVAGVDTEPVAAPASWSGDRLRGEMYPPELVVQETPADSPRAEGMVRGVPLTVTGEMAACLDKVIATIERLPDLGPLPPLDIRPMQSTGHDGGRHTNGQLLIHAETARGFCAASEPDNDDAGYQGYGNANVLLHEVAHLWFGGAVRVRDDEAAAVWESLAEYTALLAMPPGVAAEFREQYHRWYQNITDDDGLAQRVTRSAEHRRVLSYYKGPLVLTTIEEHIGRDRMIEVLRHFVSTYRGSHGSWQGVLASIEAVAGAEAAAWARPWIERGGAPDLRMVGGKVRNGRFRATLRQVTEPPFVGKVEIHVFGDGKRGERRVLTYDIGAGPVAIDVPWSDETQHAILDPRDALPRRFVQKPGPMNPELWFQHY